MFNIAQKIMVALGLFTTKVPVVLAPPAPAKKRKVSYGEGLRRHFAAKRLEAIQKAK